MKNIGCISGLPNEHATHARSKRTTGIVGIAALLLTAGIAAAQTNPSVNLPSGSEGEQSGYATHHTADLGGHLVGVTGSGSMYDTLVNIHSGFRVLGQTLPTGRSTLSSSPPATQLARFFIVRKTDFTSSAITPAPLAACRSASTCQQSQAGPAILVG